MKKKNNSLSTWGLAIFIILIFAPLTNPQISKNLHMPTASDLSSPGKFLQYLENLLGIYIHNISSTTSAEMTLLNQNLANFIHRGNTASNQQGLNAPGNAGLTAAQAAALKKNNAMNNSLENIGGSNIESSTGNGPEGNSEFNAEYNAENNSGSNSEISAEINGESTSGYNADNNSGNNSQNNGGNNSQNNSELNAEGSSGSVAGYGAASNSPNGSDQGSGNSNSNDGSGYVNPTNLPTINPIPSDDAVSQSIAKQNQQNDSLVSVLAQRQALVTPVQEAAQATKYQPVNPQTTTPSTNPAPSDIVAKVQSRQYSFH